MNGSVCYVSDERFPSRWTDTQQILKNASAMAKAGLEIEMVLPRMWPGTLFADAQSRKAILEKAYGVDITFELTQIPSIPPSRIRLEKITHGFLAPLYAMVARHDVIYTRNPMPLALGLAMGKYVVFENHRVLKNHYPVCYHCIKLLKDNPRFLGVVTNAHLISAAYREMGFESERLLLAHNAFDPEDLKPLLSKEEARQKLGLDQKRPIVCYAGHIQKRKGIDSIIEIAAQTPEIHYLICGGYSQDVARAKQVASEASAHNLQFTGWIDVSDLGQYLYAADILLVPPASAPLFKYGNTVTPIKIYTYLAAGRVIVAPQLDDTNEILHDGENALLVEPNNIGHAAQAIRKAISEPELATKLGNNALALSKKFTWDERGERIRKFIEERLSLVHPDYAQA